MKFVVVDDEGKSVGIAGAAKEAARKAKAAVERAYTWVTDDPKRAVGIAVSAVGAAATLKKVVGKTADQKKSDRVLHQYYDPRTGLHWQLKRALTNSERAELARRTRNGEFAENVLDELGVLK